MSGGQIDKTSIIKATNIVQEFNSGQDKLSVLRRVNFDIKANSFNIIFGVSGSGKSTLLNIIAGLQKPVSGKIEIEGKDIYSLSPDELAYFRASRIGFIHQTNHWIRSLNVIENVSLPLYFLGYSKDKAKKLAKIALDRVDMASYANKMPMMLSGGEQQRIGAARALVNDPLYVIADEPTGNLDTTNGDMIMHMLLNAQSEFRRTIIVVTHNMEYVSLAEHLLHVQDGTLESIESKNVKKVTDKLMSDIKNRINHLSLIKAGNDK